MSDEQPRNATCLFENRQTGSSFPASSESFWTAAFSLYVMQKARQPNARLKAWVVGPHPRTACRAAATRRFHFPLETCACLSVDPAPPARQTASLLGLACAAGTASAARHSPWSGPPRHSISI